MTFLINLVNGVSLGSIYALIALGYTMVYGIAKMLNFAHGDIIMVGAYAVIAAMAAFGSPVLAIVASVVICALLGVTKEMVSAHNAAPASYVRVLAVRDASVMSALAGAAAVPLVTSAASALYPDLDAAATGVWALSQTAPPYDKADRDFTQRLLI